MVAVRDSRPACV